MSSTVDTIKEKLPVNEVLGAYIKLERSGTNYKAKCPFHNEKTPSFFISVDRGTYYCFGCGAKGDIFSFVQEFEGLDFRGALTMLAEKAGVEIVAENPEKKVEADRLISCLEHATFFFQKNLEQTAAALEYVKNRGLSEATISQWRVGYAQNEWRSLHDHLLTKGFSKEEMERVGLIKKSAERKGEYYDVFRGRIMFPIFDASGKVIAYSGRIIVADDKAPKYLNSPETQLFNKSETLYGLHLAKVEIRRKDYSILVEGQMDLLSVHQAGIGNAVASSGTAFTKQHLQKLQKLSQKILLAFDADDAGYQASIKSAELALSLGMDVKIAILPPGSDPAQTIQENKEVFFEAMKKTVHVIDFVLHNVLQRKLESRALGKAIVSEVLPLVNLLQSSVERAHFIAKISSRSGIKEDALWDDVKKAPQPKAAAPSAEPSATPAARKAPADPMRQVVGLIVWGRQLKEKLFDPDKVLQDLQAVIGPTRVEEMMLEALKNEHELLFEIEHYFGNKKNLADDTAELLYIVAKDELRAVLADTLKQLREAELVKDGDRIEELIVKCQEISKQISSLHVKRQS